MLEKSHGLLVDQLSYHIAKDCADSVESLVSLTDVLQAHGVKQYLLDDEDGYRLAKFRACLHYPQTQWDDFGGQEKVDHFGRIILD